MNNLLILTKTKYKTEANFLFLPVRKDLCGSGAGLVRG